MSTMSAESASRFAPVAAFNFTPDAMNESQLFVRSASVRPALATRSARYSSVPGPMSAGSAASSPAALVACAKV